MSRSVRVPKRSTSPQQGQAEEEEEEEDPCSKASLESRYLREHSSGSLRYRQRGIIMGHNCINIMLINN